MSYDRRLGESCSIEATGRGLVLDALLAEYRNIHQRVLDQVQLYETNNTRVLALLGVLFYFGLKNLVETPDGYTFFIVNAVFIVLVPAIALASVLYTGANLAKIMVWGDFLKTIENKVNRVLKNEARFYEFTGGRVMSWEFWRAKHGYAGTHDRWTIVTFSGLLVIIFLASAVVSVIVRLRFLYERCSEHFPSWAIATVVVIIAFLAVATYYYLLFRRKQAESLRAAEDDATV